MEKHIIQIGNSIVRTKSKAIPNNQISLNQQLIKNLTDSMRKAELVGIAAPQIGQNLQIFVTEIRKTKLRKRLKDTDPLRIFVNPRIIATSKTTEVGYEGCGSVIHARLFGPVKRHKKIKITAFDQHGRPFTLEAEGLLARVIQHEYDHLQGILCIDKFTDTKKVMERKEFLKK